MRILFCSTKGLSLQNLIDDDLEDAVSPFYDFRDTAVVVDSARTGGTSLVKACVLCVNASVDVLAAAQIAKELQGMA